jgi:hypothetical protein
VAVFGFSERKGFSEPERSESDLSVFLLFGTQRLFGTQIWKAEPQKKASLFEKLELNWNWKLKANFTMVGVSVGSSLRCSAGLRSKK